MCFYRGYRSVRLLGSVAGTRLYNLVHWASEADYREFEKTSDTAGRMAAIQSALDGLSGADAPRMTEVPRYAVLREVAPASEHPTHGGRSRNRPEPRSLCGWLRRGHNSLP